MSDVLERIAAANPVPQEPPASAWTAPVLLDEIDARRLQTTIDKTVDSLSGPPSQSSGTRIIAAVGAFALVLVLVGVIGLMAIGGGTGVFDTSPTPPATGVFDTSPTPPATGAATTTDAVSVAESFYTAYLEGDWDAANDMAQGAIVRGENGNLLWEVDVVDIECKLVVETLVSCTSSQTDVLTRRVDTARVWQSEGTMLVADGIVTWYTSENGLHFYGDYEEWLDDQSLEWEYSQCSHGGYLSVQCLPLYLDNIGAWLATEPDLTIEQ
ncbi:MAG: hypothetical protein ACR2NL_04065 [Acidimicrobiia bacterium]